MTVDPDRAGDRMLALIGARGDIGDLAIYREEVEQPDPVKMLRDLEALVVFVGRYMRQDYERVEQETMVRVLLWMDILSEFIRMESGITKNSGENNYR